MFMMCFCKSVSVFTMCLSDCLLYSERAFVVVLFFFFFFSFFFFFLIRQSFCLGCLSLLGDDCIQGGIFVGLVRCLETFRETPYSVQGMFLQDSPC